MDPARSHLGRSPFPSSSLPGPCGALLPCVKFSDRIDCVLIPNFTNGEFWAQRCEVTSQGHKAVNQ